MDCSGPFGSFPCHEHRHHQPFFDPETEAENRRIDSGVRVFENKNYFVVINSP